MSAETVKIEVSPSTTGLPRIHRVAAWKPLSTLAALGVSGAAAATTAATGAPNLQQTETLHLRYVTASGFDNVFETEKSNAHVEASLTQLTIMQAGTESALRSLAAQVADLRARIEASSYSSQLLDDDSLTTSRAEIEAALMRAQAAQNAAEVGELLDLAADHEFTSETLLGLATNWLHSDMPFIRAAAARLLALNDPQRALHTLPSLLESEQNATAKSIMRAALRSVAA